jgi:general secretion pathway protein B
MSFILDALRKSELERQRQSGPSIAKLPVARDDRRLPVALVAIGVLLAVNVAVLAYFLLRDDAAPGATPSTASAAAPATASPAPQASAGAAAARPGDSPAAQAMPAEPMPGPPASDAPEAPDPTLLPEAPYAPPEGGGVRYEAPPVPSVDTLPPQATAGLAELAVDLHIYSDDPARRAVFINGRRYTEGMVLAEGPTVEEINRDGVVINHRGQRFLLPRN